MYGATQPNAVTRTSGDQVDTVALICVKNVYGHVAGEGHPL